jgi:hypothetical protein
MISFAASISTPSWRGPRSERESIQLGEYIQSTVHHYHKRHLLCPVKSMRMICKVIRYLLSNERKSNVI